MRTWGWLVWLALLGGCGGEYILTVGDQLAPAGGQAIVVSRLQRREVLPVAVKDAAMRYVGPDGVERAAYSDARGYAGAALPAPPTPGQYLLTVSHLDSRGEEAVREVPLYVWQADKPAVAVDLHAAMNPLLGSPEEVRAALKRLAEQYNILYLTFKDPAEHPAVHQTLQARDYPDGPVLMWQREYWRMEQQGRFARVVVETRLVGQLEQVRKSFARLEAGVCDSAEAARAYSLAGMRCIVLGPAAADGKDVQRLASWQQLAEEYGSGGPAAQR